MRSLRLLMAVSLFSLGAAGGRKALPQPDPMIPA